MTNSPQITKHVLEAAATVLYIYFALSILAPITYLK